MRILLLLAIFFNLTLLKAKAAEKEVILTKDNVAVLSSVVTEESVSKLIGEIRKMDSQLPSGYPIYLFLYTPGGSIQAGLEFIEFAKGVNRPIHTVTMFAASMGFQIAQNLGTRYITRFGVLMSHKAAGGFQGEFGGESSQLDSRYGMWLRRVNELDSKTVERTNGKKTLKQYQSEYDNELWLNGKEAVENGYADEVATVKCAADLDGERTEVVNFLGMNLTVSYDNCPLRTAPVSVSAQIRTNKGIMSLEDFLNKGGVFEKKATNSWDSQSTPKEELYSLDEGTNLTSIQKNIKDYKNDILNVKKNIVRMSFKNFVTE